LSARHDARWLQWAHPSAGGVGALDLHADAEVFELDLFDTPPSAIALLKSKGRRVVCYFSAGTVEAWRPDALHFAAGDTGRPVEQAPGEQWLDTRSDRVREIMKARLYLAAARGCEGVDADNVDGYAHATGFALDAATQLDYNRFIAAGLRTVVLPAALDGSYRYSCD
jgi:hypothetical protein